MMVLSAAISTALLGATFVAAETAAQRPDLASCSEAFLSKAVRVAAGHGPDFEVVALQIGRDRCDCYFDLKANTRSCKASVTSEAEAVSEED